MVSGVAIVTTGVGNFIPCEVLRRTSVNDHDDLRALVVVILLQMQRKHYIPKVMVTGTNGIPLLALCSHSHFLSNEFDSGTKCLQSSHSFLIVRIIEWHVPKFDRFYPRKHFSPVRRLCNHRFHISLSSLYHIKPFSYIVEATVDL